MSYFRKRKIILFFVAVLTLGGIALVIENSSTLADKIFKLNAGGRPCAFCNPKVIQSQIFYEGTSVVALLNYKPLLKGHTLILPKRNVVRFEDLTPEEILEIGTVVSKVQRVFKEVYGTNDYVLYLQNGINAGQTEFHVHFHMIPRGKEGVVMTKLKLIWAFFTEATHLRKAMTPEELSVALAPLREAMIAN